MSMTFARLGDYLNKKVVNRLCFLISELELWIMIEILIVFLSTGLVGLTIWLFVFEPHGKIHDL
jgi:flagellar basal body-associated protein FliL